MQDLQGRAHAPCNQHCQPVPNVVDGCRHCRCVDVWIVTPLTGLAGCLALLKDRGELSEQVEWSGRTTDIVAAQRLIQVRMLCHDGVSPLPFTLIAPLSNWQSPSKRTFSQTIPPPHVVSCLSVAWTVRASQVSCGHS